MYVSSNISVVAIKPMRLARDPNHVGRSDTQLSQTDYFCVYIFCGKLTQRKANQGKKGSFAKVTGLIYTTSLPKDKWEPLLASNTYHLFSPYESHAVTIPEEEQKDEHQHSSSLFRLASHTE